MRTRFGVSLSPRVLARAALLGAATGSRSTVGLAALALTAREGWLARRPVRIGFVAGACVELVIDKLAVTPSRLKVGGLVSRLVAAAACGALVGQRDGADRRAQAGAAALSSVAALKCAVLGAGWRCLASRRFGGDLPGAVAEDLTSATLAAIGARLV